MPETKKPFGGLLARRPVVVAMGVRLFAMTLTAQDVRVVHIDWSPPAGGDQEMLDLLSELL